MTFMMPFKTFLQNLDDEKLIVATAFLYNYLNNIKEGKLLDTTYFANENSEYKALLDFIIDEYAFKDLLDSKGNASNYDIGKIIKTIEEVEVERLDNIIDLTTLTDEERREVLYTSEEFYERRMLGEGRQALPRTTTDKKNRDRPRGNSSN